MVLRDGVVAESTRVNGRTSDKECVSTGDTSNCELTIESRVSDASQIITGLNILDSYFRTFDQVVRSLGSVVGGSTRPLSVSQETGSFSSQFRWS